MLVTVKVGMSYFPKEVLQILISPVALASKVYFVGHLSKSYKQTKKMLHLIAYKLKICA